jgi:hypothetical protein
MLMRPYSYSCRKTSNLRNVFRQMYNCFLCLYTPDWQCDNYYSIHPVIQTDFTFFIGQERIGARAISNNRLLGSASGTCDRLTAFKSDWTQVRISAGLNVLCPTGLSWLNCVIIPMWATTMTRWEHVCACVLHPQTPTSAQEIYAPLCR